MSEYNNKSCEKIQAVLTESEEFRFTLAKAGFAESTRKLYLRAFNKFAKLMNDIGDLSR